MAVNPAEGASPPVFEQIFRNARFAQGGNALFEGKVKGNPRPQVVWTRKGLQMKATDKHQMVYDENSGKVSLMIKSIGPGDEGEYTCTALNPYGEAICTVYISPEATKSVKKSKSGAKLHKSGSSKQIQQQQQQSMMMQQQQQSFSSSMQQASMSSSSSFHQESSSFSSAQMMKQSSHQQSSSSSSSVQIKQQSQQQMMTREQDPEVIYLKHVERSAQQQQRQQEEMSRYGPPSFLGPLNDLTIMEGEKAHLDAKVAPVGDPSIKVEWYCNGQAITASSRVNTACQFGFVSLDMLNTTVNDSGEYICVVQNEAGQTQSSCRVIVQPRKEIEPDFYSQGIRQVEMKQEAQQTKVIEVMEAKPAKPEFVKPLADLGQMAEGSNVHLEAQVNPVSDHTMSIDWFKDGKAITASSRIGTIYSFGYVSLNITGLRVEDAGTYICVARNASGEAMTQASIGVTPEAKLTSATGIAEQQVYIEKTAQLEQFQQSKTMTRMDSVVEPNQPPQFTTPLQDQCNVREGGFAHFEARLEPMGDHSMTVEWYKDNKPVDASSRITSFFNFGYVALTIKQVASHDAGLYSCVARNAKGQTKTEAQLTTVSKAESDFQGKSWSSIQQMEMSKTVKTSSMEIQVKEEAPRFVSQLKGTTVILEGQHAHFECRLEPQNDPKLKVEWTHNGRPLTASSRIQTHHDFGYVALDIMDVKKEDAGTYILQASNALGKQEAKIDLKVETHAQAVDMTTMHAKALEATQKFEMKSSSMSSSTVQEVNVTRSKPVFVTPLQDLKAPVNEGSNIHLEARLEPIGDPSIKVEWFCNGRPLTIGSRFKTYNDFGFIALDIVGVNLADAGQYTCRASNQLGQAETSAGVQVIAKANVVTETEHEAAMQQISYLESHQTSIQSSMQQHQEMTSIHQGPSQPPKFTKLLKNVEAVEGQTIHLEARLSPTGDSTMKVEWTVNGKPLKTGHKIKPQYDFDFVALDLLGVYPEDSGTYTCTARNALGEATTSAQVKISGGAQVVTESKSQMSQFAVLEQKQTRQEIYQEENTTQAPVFTSSMKSIEVKEGQRAHFECRIIPVSDPTLKVEWMLNGKPLKQGSRFREGMDFGFVYLDIMHVNAEDAGTYTLKATNVLGSAVNSADLRVKSKETIIKETMHAAAVEQIAHLEHSGQVSQVSHEEGFTTQAPVFTSTMRDMQVMEGTPAHFEAKLIPIGDPKLKVEWVKNGKPIQASNRISYLHDFGFVALDLKYTRPDDAGNYTCRAINELGEANITAKLNVVSAKEGPQAETLHGDALNKIAHLESRSHGGQFMMEEDAVASAPNFVVSLQGKSNLIEGQNLHIECRIEPYPDATLNVEWYLNDKPLPFGNRWRTSYDFGFAALDIIGAYAEDSGRYTLKAKNALGTAESHIEVKIAPRSGLLLDSDHVDALQKIKYLESKHQRTAEEELAVSEPPQFGHGLKDIRLEEGQPAHFETTLTPVNDSSMRVEWLFNGKPVPQGHRFRTTYDFGFVALDILYAYPEDSGTYTCFAKNNLGETSTTSNLLVQGKSGLLLDTMDRERLTHLKNLESRDTRGKGMSEVDAPITKPVFTTPLNNISNVAEQSNVHLECRLEPLNDPNLKVEWYVNGKAIKMGHRFKTTHDFGYVALDILYAYPEDNGTYMCKASNKLGEAVNTCSVEVVGRQSLMLDSHHPEGWEKVKHLEARSAAHGRLEVEDMPVGPPQFVTELMGQTSMAEGQIAHFEAQIEPIHDSDLQVEFLHNGRPLKQASRIHTLCDFGYVALDIGQLIESDAGTYTCKVKNKFGEATSSVTLNIAGRGSLDTSSVRPEGLEKIKALESKQAKLVSEEATTFQKPVFTQPLKNLLKEENTNAHFSCTLIPVGDPTLKVEWFKDGQKVSTGTRINAMHDFGLVNLDISGVRSSDEGIYEVRATNSLGEAMTTASLKVASKDSLILDSQHPEGMKKITALESSKARGKGQAESDQKFDKPVFVETLKGTEAVAEGQQAHMECRIEPTNDPNLKFNWFKNGEPLNMSSRIHATQDFGFVTLDIQSCVPEDSGMYTVKATNLIGEASSSLALHVGGKGGVLGDALHPGSYEKIKALEARKGVKQQVSVEDVKQPPVFMEPLRDVGTVAEGSNVLVEAQIEPKNDPTLKVEWELNGQSITTGSRLKTSLDFGHVVLEINGARASDSGLYTCKAINVLGEAVSTTSIKVEESSGVAPAIAKDIGPPKFVSQFNQAGDLGEGQSCHLEARLTPIEDPNLKVEWFKDGKALPTGHRFRTFHDFGIVILDILYCYAEDSGVYECKATNAHGTDSISCQIKCSAQSGLILTPQVPDDMKQHTMSRIQHLESMKMKRSTEETVTSGVAPRFTVPIENMNNLREGENAHFEARLIPTDDPTLSIEWYWNGKALKAGSRIRTFCDFGFVILEISPVYPEDSGEYMCKAKNALGEAVTTATLKCSGKRQIIMDSQLPRGMEGAIDKIANLEGLGRRRAMEDPMEDADAPPEFLSPLEDLVLPENSLAHFETRLTPINDPSMRVEWFQNGKQLSAGSRIKTINDFGFVILEVANVMTRDSGNYTCKAVNKHGEASVSCNVQVKSKQSIITDPQLPRSFKSGTDSILKLEENKWKRMEHDMGGDELDARPPIFVSKIKDLNVIEGQPAHFDCRIEPIGDGSMQISWFHNDQPIQIGSRIHTISDFGFVVLDIDWTFKRDAGVYTCRATNKYGTAEARATLHCSSKKDINLDSQLPQGMSLDKLKDLEKGKTELRGIEDEAEITAPKFITKIQSRAVAEGEPVHFSCRVEPKHDPKLNITWYHNDKELPSGSRFRITQEFGYVALDILYTYPEDEGEYVCKAKNELGEDVVTCKLVCKELPAIQLENQVPKGMKKSEYLMQMEASMKKYAQEIMLTEDDVYDIEKRQPPRFVTQIQSVTDLVEMQATKFECQLAPVGDPNMKVEWFFNGKSLPFKNRFTPIFDFGYVAMNFGWVYPEDSGEYVCRATNAYGMDETRGIIKTSGKPGIIFESQLPKGMASIDRIRKMESGWQRAPELVEPETERFKPCFVTKPEPQEVAEGEVARFCCRVTGYPKPRVMWLLNGHTVINGSKHKLVYDGMWHFDIPKCRDIDGGKVEVIARNSCGEAYASTTLTVNPRQDDYRAVLRHNVKRDYVNSKEYRQPEWITQMEEIQKRLSEQKCSAKFTQEIKDQRVKEGMKAKFEAHFAGNPKPEITWEFDGKLIENSKNIQIKIKEGKTTLTIMESAMEHNGYYTCRVKNNLGSDRTRGLITVSKPGAEKDKPKEKVAKLVKSEESKMTKKAEQKTPEQPKADQKPAKTWGKSGSKKAEPPKAAEPEPKVELKKAEQTPKQQEEPKKEPAKLKPTPKEQKPAPAEQKESVQLKPVKKEDEVQEKKPAPKTMPTTAAPAPTPDDVDSTVAQAPEKTEKPQALEVTTEIQENVDVAPKEAGVSQVPEMSVATSKQPEMQASAVMGEVAAAESTQALNIQEGDVFFALATFVSETGEAMNLVEGEKVHVLEWNNTDWWYVRKHLTEESGWVPAQYLKDEQTYTMYVQKKLVEKIEKLPVFDKPKDGEESFAPKILESVKSMSAADGSQVEFVCKVEGSPRPQITWFRQTAIIKPSQDFQIFYYEDNKATLVIKEVFPEDAGTFTCVAKNCVGFASSSAELIVEHPLSEHGSAAMEKHDRRSLSRESSLADIVEGIPPTFAQRPQTKSCEEGNATELECRFVAIPEAEVQWFHNKTALVESNRIKVENQADMHMYCSIVRISNVTKEDEGTYEVSAKNREGEATNTLILNVTGKPKEPVNEPPIIVKQLTPTVCKLGDSVKLETVITGTPTPKVEWTHNGAVIQSSAGIKMTEKENIYSLIIDNVEQTADGEYSVKAVNSSGSVQTSANLAVQGEAVEFVKQLEDIEIKEKAAVELDVETSAEETNVVWFKDGEQISKTNENYEFKKAGRKHSLIIKDANVHLEGEYSAVAGEQETTCELTVVELPAVFTKKITNQTVTAGEQVFTFETELSKGDAVTKWYKNSAEIKDSDRFKIKIDGKVQRLEIHNVETADAGEYLCTIGNEKCTAQLTVEEPKVTFVEKLETTTSGEEGQDIELTVKLSNESAQVKWFKDGAEVTASDKFETKVEKDSHKLKIRKASVLEVGEYTCQAENVTSKTEVEVKSSEEKVEMDETTYSKDQVGIKGQDITFKVNFKQELGSKPKASWSFNGKEIIQSERIHITTTRKMVSMTIKQVEQVDCGSYTVKISNSVSEIASDFNLMIKDKPSAPRGPASVEWKDTTMVLTWNASESDGGDPIIGYVVERREVGKKTWKQVATANNTSLEIKGLKKNSSFNFRISAKNNVGNSQPLILEETVTTKAEVKKEAKGLPGSPTVQVTAITSKSVTLNWSPPINTGGVELTGYIIEKRLSTTHKWEKAATVDPSVTQFTIENLKEKCEYYFRVSAENEVGAGEPASSEKVALRTSARPPTQPTAPLEIVALGPHSIMVEWGAPESDGGAPLEGYKVAVRDAQRHMWMEVGRVAADIQKLKVQELAEGNLYHLRIYAKNEVGFSDPLENEEPFKVIRPPDYNEEEAAEEEKHDDTPSLSFSTTETLSSWMREANVDADIQSYTKSTILRRDEYFFRIWHYASKLFQD